MDNFTLKIALERCRNCDWCGYTNENKWLCSYKKPWELVENIPKCPRGREVKSGGNNPFGRQEGTG